MYTEPATLPPCRFLAAGRMILAAASLAALVACGGNEADAGESRDAGGSTEFWAALQGICGGAYYGAQVEGNDTDSPFTSGELVMHVRECSDSEIRIALQVGDDHSRTLVLARTGSGLSLTHDQRLPDGSEHAASGYGGATRDPGTGEWQEFHADARTAGLPPDVAAAVWTVEVVPGDMFVYAMRRDGGDRRFRLQFDLTQPAPLPQHQD